MKRREFVKLVTAAVPLALIPAAILSTPSIDVSKIEWMVTQEPAYGYATRIMLAYDNYVASVIVDDVTVTEKDINWSKQYLLHEMEKHLTGWDNLMPSIVGEAA